MSVAPRGAREIRLLIADDQPLVRTGLARWFANTELKIVAQADRVEDLVRLAIEQAADVALIETHLGGRDVLPCLAEIRCRRPATAVLIFSAYDNSADAARALDAQAAGFLLKTAGRERLLETIRLVAGGRTAWQARDARRLRRALAAPPTNGDVGSALTARETQVLSQLALGLTNREIAQVLAISPETVKEHVQRVLRKIGVRDRTQAAVWMARKRRLS
ncbi:MAG: response regulator transcription factor [Pirellulales bacterium]